jgi:hypothetical protein
LESKELYLKSSIFGSLLGIGFGTLIGALTGILSAAWNGILFCAIAGFILGIPTGILTGAVVVWTSGRTGGVSTGAYTGMVFGALFGGLLGIFIPDSFRAAVATLHILVLDVLTHGRFETAILLSYLVSITATMVGAWIGGRNLKPRDLTKAS